MIGLATGRAEAMSLTLSRVQKLTTNMGGNRSDNSIVINTHGFVTQNKSRQVFNWVA